MAQTLFLVQAKRRRWAGVSGNLAPTTEALVRSGSIRQGRTLAVDLPLRAWATAAVMSSAF